MKKHGHCLIARCLKYSTSTWQLRKIIAFSVSVRIGLYAVLGPFLGRLWARHGVMANSSQVYRAPLTNLQNPYLELSVCSLKILISIVDPF